MKLRRWRLIFFAVGTCVLAGFIWLIASAPRNPVALIRVVDAAGKPVAGVVITPAGLRTKPGPYVSGWYGWMTSRNGVPDKPVTTDKSGYARVPYPKFVFEHIETGKIIFSVNHPDFVPDQPERVVSIAPPKGAPWKVWRDYALDLVQHKAKVALLEPVVLLKGASLRLSLKPGSAAPKDAKLFAQISGEEDGAADFWQWPEPGVLMTRRMAAGTKILRAIKVESSGWAWFSDIIKITAVVGQTNDVIVELKRGVGLHGKLDASVPRPVRNGRVIAHVWPHGAAPQDSPPQWHAWSIIRDDGSFDIGSVPEGDLEVVALCSGFISTNGPGQFKMIYPQKHIVGTNDLTITVGMQPTVRVDVHVTDDKGKPLSSAYVCAWPNVRYGEWSATVVGGDCYNTSDAFLPASPKRPGWRPQSIPDFGGTSDATGLAVIPNLPTMVTELSVEHTNYVLPAVPDFVGGKRREATITLKPGETNHVYLKLEPCGQSTIAHF